MDEISAALLSKALDGLSQRFQFTAQNIANAGTPDYSPVRVSFEESLRDAAQHGPAAIRAVEPTTHFDPVSDVSSGLRLDLELASASQTAMRYHALTEILGRQMALSRAVVSDGGR